MDTEYKPLLIEETLQKIWEQKKTYRAQEDINKQKFYSLSMLPYPSGQLHMGHVRNYTIGDVIARYQRMLGKNVLQPIGWDAFGLPAENAAIKNKTAPSKWTYENISQMRTQLKRLGFAYDWSREVTTCQPNYYQWEQWFFLKLYEKGLVYKKNAEVNWDPVDQTVLANEQVINGRGWRSNALIERKSIPQWFLKITAYSEELLNDLDTLKNWPDPVKTMQKNWIGQSVGVDIDFKLNQKINADPHITIFTTRPDTIFGASFLAIAPNHPIATAIAEQNQEIAAFIQSLNTGKVAEADIVQAEKLGIATGLSVKHPLSDIDLPIWIANFVLMEYGTGAIMAVPAHDQRDWDFATKYKLPIQAVIRPQDHEHDFKQSAYTGKGILVHSDEFNDLGIEVAQDKIIQHLEKLKKGKRQTTYRLRDWGISRQRYWGTPIPIIECPTCGTVPVPYDDLPVILPEDINLAVNGSALKQETSFYETECPQCKQKAMRETDTFDTFVESSWYYARYCSANQEKSMLDERANYWTPVDFYVGGVEHAVMHLLYARFFHKLMRDADLLNSNEPFTQLLTQGMVLKDGAKMSKSKGNIIDPQKLIEKYGADTVRLFIIFAAPPEQSLEWSEEGVEGVFRFLKRLWASLGKHSKLFIHMNQSNALNHFEWKKLSPDMKETRRESQKILKQILHDYERIQLNTVVSGAMKLLNMFNQLTLNDTADESAMLAHEIISNLLRILAPITPHISETLWQELQFSSSLISGPWVKLSKEAFDLHTVEYIVQINGKLRGKITVPQTVTGDDLVNVILKEKQISKHLEGRKIKRSIIVNARRVINLVLQ